MLVVGIKRGSGQAGAATHLRLRLEELSMYRVRGLEAAFRGNPIS